MARTELFGRAGAGHVFGCGAVVGGCVLQLFAQAVDAVERRGFEFVELLA